MSTDIWKSSLDEEMEEEDVSKEDFTYPDYTEVQDEDEIDESMLLNEENCKQLDKFSVIEYENKNKEQVTRKDELITLEEKFKTLHEEFESLAVSNTSTILKLKEISNNIKETLDVKQQAQNLISKVEEFRKAEDLSDVDFDEIVNRVMLKINDSRDKGSNKTNTVIKKETSFLSYISILISILVLGYVLFFNKQQISISELMEESKSFEKTIVMKDKTKVFCEGEKKPFLAKEGKVTGIQRGNLFYFKLDENKSCYFYNN